MNVGLIYGNQCQTNIIKSLNDSSDCMKKDLKTTRKDTVEISESAYKLNEKEKMTATSGKDNLGITKGDKDNSFVIHFGDSAMVSRAVSRGYITVNGIKLDLSEEMKQQLLKVDREASKEREKAYNEYVMQHEMAVAKQQSETLKKAFGNIPNSLKILLEIDSDTPKQSGEKKNYANALKAYENANTGVGWSQFEWKSYDTQMKVFVGESITVESISKGEIIMN